MKSDTDVLVIGGGVIGVCAAYYLAEQGLRVSLVEQEEIGSGCSGENAGLIVPSHSIPLAAPGALGQGLKWVLKPDSPFYIKPRFDPTLLYWVWKFRKACKPKQMQQGLHVLRELNYASSELFKHLVVDESLTCNYRHDGWLMIYSTDEAFQKAQQEALLLQSYGIKLKILQADESLEMEPTLHPEISGGIFFPEDTHLDPAKFVQALAERLRERGVTIHAQTKALEFDASHGCVTTVRTTCGDFQPKQVVLAAGAWSAGLVKNLGIRLLLQPAKGYDFNINLHRVYAIMRAPIDYLKDIKILDTTKIWRGLRSCTPDGLPIIDRFADYNNLFIATGHCMLGITQAPITGKLVSQLICEQVSDVNLAPFRMNRFR